MLLLKEMICQSNSGVKITVVSFPPYEGEEEAIIG